MASIREDDALLSKTPVLRHSRDLLAERESAPEESFLLGLMDGKTDVQSMLWLAPMREVDLFLGLRRLLQNNLIELVDSSPEHSAGRVGQPSRAGTRSPRG